MAASPQPQLLVSETIVPQQQHGVSTQQQQQQQQQRLPTDPASESSSSSSSSGRGSQQRQVIYVRDDDGLQYVLPWEMARDWGSFEVFIKDVFRRKASDWFEEIENGEFEVFLQKDPRSIVLPGIWALLVMPGDTVVVFPRSKVEGIAVSDSPRENWEESGESGESGDDENSPPSVVSVSDENSVENSVEIEDDEESEEGGHDEGSEDSEQSEETDSEAPPLPEPVRSVIPPVDDEGNKLSFIVDSSCSSPSRKPGKEAGGDIEISRKPVGRPVMNTENLRITRAMSVTSERRTMIQIHTLPGPESSSFSSSIHTRWTHLYADWLDWAQFKNVCLSTQGISDRMQKVISKLFLRIEKERLKAYVDGMFVEPGTTLRADDSDHNDPQSVIFSCIPYFELQKSLPTASARSDNLHPSRTLMQAYYPYEPVQDRDNEQAFRKFGNTRSGSLVHIPSMWMMNIGSHAVVTCGYRPLAVEFVKSIEVMPEDPKLLSMDMHENKLTAIRLTEWSNRVLIYQRDECRTYFEMERKLRELKFSSGNAENSIQLLTNTQKGPRRITPLVWPYLITQKNVIFIDVFVTTEAKLKEIGQEMTLEDLPSSEPAVFAQNTWIPPFFQWPASRVDEKSPLDLKPMNAQQTSRCLEHVEKAMFDQGLLKGQTISAVDETFTSSKYYDELPEVDYDGFLVLLAPTLRAARIWEEKTSYGSFHEKVVGECCSKLAHEISDFVNVVRGTLKLFVSDMNQSILLRKLWGAMSNLLHIAKRTVEMRACASDQQEYLDPDWELPVSGTRLWHIRSPKRRDGSAVLVPEGKEAFARSIRKCRKCRHKSFDDPNAAVEHLRSIHLGEEVANTALAGREIQPDAQENKYLRDWVYNEDQWIVESTVQGAVEILSYSTKEARNLCKLLQELADGVRNEDGGLSSLYTFPRKLLPTFHKLVVLYFAVERSLHFIEKRRKTEQDSDMREEGTNQEQLADNSEILRRFSEGVKALLLLAREDLCNMARSAIPKPIEERLAFGSEYICSWLMRRLIVKPLDRSMSIADMYREYLSTIQFQVNHRPGKRLLRSIKLVQEEIMILAKVTSWQARLVANYSKVLDDDTYPTLLPSRRAMFPFERLLLDSCSDSIALTSEELADQFDRCGPLSDSTKQSAEINEEDHGKAIFVFTVVTAIFLPLSFITSYLGMNTSDIRDMENSQALFWQIAAPLTVAVMGSVLFIAYNGDEIRDNISSTYRNLTGKQTRITPTRGSISIIQRKRAAQATLSSDTTSSTDMSMSLADEAEYATPRPAWPESTSIDKTYAPPPPPTTTVYNEIISVDPDLRTRSPTRLLRAQPRSEPIRPRVRLAASAPPPPSSRYTRPATTRPVQYESSARPQPPPPTYPHPPSYEPTQMRLHRKFLAPETLAHYALSYDVDPKDDNFIVVRQPLDQATMAVLFAHTRQLRERERAERGHGRGVSGRVVTREYYGGDEWYGRGYGGGYGDVDAGVEDGYLWVTKDAAGARGGGDGVREREGGGGVRYGRRSERVGTTVRARRR
ncbi:unnamed protein product [Periconia digitata]|uniref:Ubiquitin-like domain-containing protein n=1 Tax=Periconia digitata TaxID=1303443 RepID=A0A9W4XQT1_9PLEO|nr:unnamed protein product [Periconia digitata]